MTKPIALLVLAGCGRLGFGATDIDAQTGDVDSAPACGIVLGAGRQHTTAVLSDGSLRVWGFGAFGQIGDGQMMDRPSPTPIALSARVIHAAGGRYETCVALETGTVQCWGEGDSGQLGDGNGTTSASPVVVANLTNAVEVAAAALHACARLATGEVWCWGNGGSGRLGTGGTAPSLVPVRTQTITDAKLLIAGGSASCVILADDTLRCWGYNQTGGIGINTTTDVLTPVEPIGLGTVRAVTSRDTTTCAVRSDGAAFCWGLNSLGQAGLGMIGGTALVPMPVQTASGALTGADDIGQGFEHGCARLGTTAWCWGRNDDGQLGDGTIGAGRPYAAPVVGLPPIVKLGVGAWTNCGVDTADGVWCWGLGMNGELGGGIVRATQPMPMLSFTGCAS